MKENRPNKVILHCSASPDARDTYFTFQKCKDFHMNDRGWADIGYHYYIERDGTTYQGRAVNVAGAHCWGHNTTSIGVCYEGTYFPTILQIKALCDLYRTIRSVHGIVDWRGHREFTNKECPGFDIEDLIGIFNKLS